MIVVLQIFIYLSCLVKRHLKSEVESNLRVLNICKIIILMHGNILSFKKIHYTVDLLKYVEVKRKLYHIYIEFIKQNQIQ